MNGEDLAILKILRQVFIEDRESSTSDYWHNPAHVAIYEKFFARRIAWKWKSVLTELLRVEWRIPANISDVIDWGCGSGVASETLLESFPETKSMHFHFVDRSTTATAFCVKKISAFHPDVRTSQNQIPNCLSNSLLVVSHVITELSLMQRQSLFELAMQCAAVIWVEPGSFFCAKALVEFREFALGRHKIISPCFHQNPCGLALPEREHDWCHFFAASPDYIFHDAEWRAFSRELVIDLRSLPVSWMISENKAVNAEISSPKQCFFNRVLAKPRTYKGYTRMLVCEDSGVFVRDWQHKNHKSNLKSLEEQTFPIIPFS